MQSLKDLIGWESPQKTNANVGDLLDAEPEQNRITMIGTMGAGKSAHLAGLLIAADRKVSKSRDTDYPFRYYLREGSGNIEHDKSHLRNGHFPPKTSALKASSIEQRITFEWAHETTIAGKKVTLSKRQSDMPICDLAGEDLCQLIEKVAQTRTLAQVSMLNMQRVAGIIMQSSGLMLIVKASRAQGLEFELEKEPVGIDGLSIYSDANLKRMIDGIVRFKRQNRNSPTIKGVAVIITAWDALSPVAEQISARTGTKFDPCDIKISQESLDKFMYAFFPSTHAAIASLNLHNTRYFPSFFNIERDSNGNPVCWDGSDSPKIQKPQIFDPGHNWEDNVNTVSNSEFWFFKELDWLQEFASLG